MCDRQGIDAAKRIFGSADTATATATATSTEQGRSNAWRSAARHGAVAQMSACEGECGRGW